jgi:sec-independent protein translocase protein TatB
MFDVGFTELLLLAIIGLLVLGPERLPKVARTLGGLSRKARSSWINLKRSIDAEINAEEIKQPLKKAQENIRSAVDGVDKQLKDVSARANASVGASIGAAASAGKAAEKPAESSSTSSDPENPASAEAKPGSNESS